MISKETFVGVLGHDLRNPLNTILTTSCNHIRHLVHETTHWTAHESCLARDFGTTRFGSEGYSIEELVAKLGAAFLCPDLDLTLEPREDHAAYIANWLDVLKADNCAIFAAASHAQRTADFINGLQPASAG